MKKKKDVVINIEPFHAEVRTHEKGFTLQFMTNIGNDYSRRKKVNIKMERWWVIHLARELKKVIESEERELQRIKDGAGFKD